MQAAAGADIVMLDNYSAAALIEDGTRLKAAFPGIIIEASGVGGSGCEGPWGSQRFQSVCPLGGTMCRV